MFSSTVCFECIVLPCTLIVGVFSATACRVRAAVPLLDLTSLPHSHPSPVLLHTSPIHHAPQYRGNSGTVITGEIVLFPFLHVCCHYGNTLYQTRQLIFLRKSDCLGCAVLLNLLCCLFDLACFFLSSFLLISH